MHELVIKGGRIALNDDWSECDIGIDDGRISAIGSSLPADRTIDESQRWVLARATPNLKDSLWELACVTRRY